MSRPSPFRFGLRVWREAGRFVILGMQAPQALGIFSLVALLRPFAVTCQKIVPAGNDAARSQKVEQGDAVGWVQGERIFRFARKGRVMFDFHVHDEKALHILNFYYFRKSSFILDDLQNFELQGLKPRLFSGMKIFEPGCNMGRMLLMLKDLYHAQVTGVDIYEPSIRMAQKIKGRDDEFRVENILAPGWLKSLPDDYFDLSIASSFINHVASYAGYDDFIHDFCRVSRQVYIHDRALDNPAALDFIKAQYPHQVMLDGSTQFSFLASK